MFCLISCVWWGFWAAVCNKGKGHAHKAPGHCSRSTTTTILVKISLQGSTRMGHFIKLTKRWKKIVTTHLALQLSQRYYEDFSNHATQILKPIIGDFGYLILVNNQIIFTSHVHSQKIWSQIINIFISYIHWLRKSLVTDSLFYSFVYKNLGEENSIGPSYMTSNALAPILHWYCKYTNHVKHMQCMLHV